MNYKILKIFSISLIIMFLLSGCGEKTKTSNKITVISTTFAAYDWVNEIAGERVDSVLLGDGADMHSYQPTASDILKISECDIFIYVGGESEKWIYDALSQTKSEKRSEINLLSVLGDSAKSEDVTNIADTHEEEDSHEHEESEYDEHVWLSLKNAVVFCREISQALSNIDKENSSVYNKNTQSYVAKLQLLDEEYQDVVTASKLKTLLFADRFPFRYLTDDYGILYYAAFPGCSAETDASFATVAFLAEKLNELKLSHVIVIDGGQDKIAKAVIAASNLKNQEILTLNSMQSLTVEDAKNGITYISIVKDNYDVIKKALKSEAD